MVNEKKDNPFIKIYKLNKKMIELSTGQKVDLVLGCTDYDNNWIKEVSNFNAKKNSKQSK